MKDNHFSAALMMLEKDFLQMEKECVNSTMPSEKLFEKRKRIKRLMLAHKIFSKFLHPDEMLSLEKKIFNTLEKDKQLTGCIIIIRIREGKDNFTEIEEDWRK